MQRHPMHLGGRRSALPPNPPPAFFLFKVASSHCHIASKNITKKNHKKKKKKKKKTKMTEQKTQMQRHPMHLSKNTTERNKKCKNSRCIWGGGASHSHITNKINENKKNTEKTRLPSCNSFVLKLPCLGVETDAKNPRQAGTVAKNPWY